jgi:nitrate/nitrite-specific signal transduction histidine kinase
MQRYNQQFGNVGPMIKSDDGYWVKNEDVENILHWNEESLFEVIKERNEEIARYQEEMTQMQQDIQNYADDCEEDVLELKVRNNKLFYQLVISTTVGVVLSVVVVLNLFGVI